MAVMNLKDRQVDLLVENVRLLAASKGFDVATGKKVRATVAADLLHPEKSKLSAALGKLAGTPAAECLKAVIADCRQHFELENGAMSVIVAPVAVRLRTRMSAQVSVGRAGREDLHTLSLLANARLGSEKVVFDLRIYSAADLMHATSAQLLELGRALLGGEEEPDVGMSSKELVSKGEGQWEMAYLLGFELRKKGDEPLLNEARAQRELFQWRCYAETALSEVDQVLFGKDITADVKSHGIWYSDEGLKLGEDLIRSYRLDSVVRNFEQGTRGVSFMFTHDVLQGCVRLMVQNRLMTVEHKWKLLEGEGLDGFKMALEKAIDSHVPDLDVVCRKEMEFDEYQAAARAAGVIWS